MGSDGSCYATERKVPKSPLLQALGRASASAAGEKRRLASVGQLPSDTSCRARQRITAQHHTPRPPHRRPGAAAADINCAFPLGKGCLVSNTDPVHNYLHSLLRTRQANQGFLQETKSTTTGAQSSRGACAGSNLTAVE